MKKRYVLTLTQENMEGLQQLLKDMGYKIETGIISEMVDEFIEEQLKLGIPAALSGRKPTVLDSFRFLVEKLSDTCGDDNKINALQRGVVDLQHQVSEAKNRAKNKSE